MGGSLALSQLQELQSGTQGTIHSTEGVSSPQAKGERHRDIHLLAKWPRGRGRGRYITKGCEGGPREVLSAAPPPCGVYYMLTFLVRVTSGRSLSILNKQPKLAPCAGATAL